MSEVGFEVETERGLTAVPGIGVGHHTDPAAMTGCTVVVLPEENVIAGETRGAAPASREASLLAPGMSVEAVDAVVLTGGSAFGLAAADGAMQALAELGRGFETPVGRVPIVPAAAIFDLMVGDGTVRPGPAEGAAAVRSASDGPVGSGSFGAGTGATVAKWRGFDGARPGGIGSASARHGDLLVAALVVVNAVGDVFTLEGEPLTGGPPVPGPPGMSLSPGENTTLAVVATNADLSRSALTRLAVRAQDAFSVCLRPAHTSFDGDTVFAVSCPGAFGPATVEVAAEAAFVAVGRAIEAAIRSGG